MTIVSSCDARYLPGLFVTWGSLLHSNPETDCSFYLLHDGISADSLSDFENNLRKISNRFTFHATLVDVSSFKDFPDFFFDSKMTYARLLIPRLVPSDGIVLYLDSDFLFLRKVNELGNDLPPDFTISVVEEWGNSGQCDMPRFHASYPSTITHKYFNGGFILMHLGRIRASKQFEQCVKLLHTRKSDCVWHDQTALNVIFAHQCHYLNPDWNFQLGLGRDFSPGSLSKLENQKINFHFLMSDKPWIRRNYSIPHRLFHFVKARILSDHNAANRELSCTPVFSSAIAHALRSLNQFLKQPLSKDSNARQFGKAHWLISRRLFRDLSKNRMIAKSFSQLFGS